METSSSSPTADSQSSHNATQTATTTRSTHIFDLPQELQDIIFEYAYAKPADANPVPHHKPGAPRQSAKPKRTETDDWLICKRWFVAAARAYAQSQVVPLRVANSWTQGILHAFGRDFSTECVSLCTFRQAGYPEMRSLQVELHGLYSNRILSKLTLPSPAEDEWKHITEKVAETLMSLRGLRSLSVMPTIGLHDKYGTGDHALSCLQIQELLQCIVKRPGTPEQEEGLDSIYCQTCRSDVEPLYFGSEVCGNNHSAIIKAMLQVIYKDCSPVDRTGLSPGSPSVMDKKSVQSSDPAGNGEEGGAIAENRVDIAEEPAQLPDANITPGANSRKYKRPLRAMVEASMRKERNLFASKSNHSPNPDKGSRQNVERLKDDDQPRRQDVGLEAADAQADVVMISQGGLSRSQGASRSLSIAGTANEPEQQHESPRVVGHQLHDPSQRLEQGGGNEGWSRKDLFMCCLALCWVLLMLILFLSTFEVAEGLAEY